MPMEKIYRIMEDGECYRFGDVLIDEEGYVLPPDTSRPYVFGVPCFIPLQSLGETLQTFPVNKSLLRCISSGDVLPEGLGYMKARTVSSDNVIPSKDKDSLSFQLVALFPAVRMTENDFRQKVNALFGMNTPHFDSRTVLDRGDSSSICRVLTTSATCELLPSFPNNPYPSCSFHFDWPEPPTSGMSSYMACKITSRALLDAANNPLVSPNRALRYLYFYHLLMEAGAQKEWIFSGDALSQCVAEALEMRKVDGSEEREDLVRMELMSIFPQWKLSLRSYATDEEDAADHVDSFVDKKRGCEALPYGSGTPSSPTMKSTSQSSSPASDLSNHSPPL